MLQSLITPLHNDTHVLHNVFGKLKNKNADLTVFVVQKIQRKKEMSDGWTDTELGFWVLAEIQFPSTVAYEAGHYLFGHWGKDGKWDGLHGHPWSSLDPDKTPLMKGGGGGYKIQFDLALMDFGKHCRSSGETCRFQLPTYSAVKVSNFAALPGGGVDATT